MSTMVKNLPGRKRKDREVRISLPADDKSSTAVRTSTVIERFLSVLDRPFKRWNEVENVLAAFVPEWNHTERGCLLQHLIHFLELKVVMEEERISGQLLAPTKLVNKAWQALVLESRLYKKVTCTIQSFHGRRRCQIHYSLMTDMKGAMYESMVRRTQSLFQCYYGRQMPVSLQDVELDCLAMDDASALTDAVAGWGFNQHCGGVNNNLVNSSSRRVQLEVSSTSIGDKPFVREKRFSTAEACMNALRATMSYADECVMYGLDKEDYETCDSLCEVSESTEHDVEATDRPSKKKFRV